MPQNIGPQLHLARPKTSTGFVPSHARSSQKLRAQTASAHGTRKHPQQIAEEDEEPHIELLEYEWPDLPPIINMKDAVTRRRVSKGIAYLLPVDKGKNSIDSKFRTDLRAMFQEPYATEGTGFDDVKVNKSAKIHFKTNVVDTRWTNKLGRNIPINLNSDSEKVRKLYSHSAPAGGRTKSGMSEDKLKTRSSLFLPIKATAHPEATRLRKEVENIIKSVQEDNDDFDEEKEAADITPLNSDRPQGDKRKSIMSFYKGPKHDSIDETAQDGAKVARTATSFDTYDQLKKTKPPKPVIPAELKSKDLSDEQNQQIWEWLHYGESISEFEYFLAICG